MKILIVEDDLISRRLLQKTLEDWGHEVIAAENGEQAWKIFQNENLKIVIADWMMPVMDGLALCRKIRSSNNLGYVYFLLLTGKDKQEDVVEGLDAGADDYVVKPFDWDELKVRLRAGERILELEKELKEKNEALIDLNKRLEEIAWIDPLMEIGNRRGFYNSMEKIHHRATRYTHGYGLIMCDIDYFKAYNDTYGHLEGDNVLKLVGRTIKDFLRLSDDVFRFGGEEIVVILQDQDLEKSIDVAERLRKTIELLGIEHKSTDRGILTLSCGVAAYSDYDRKNKWESILNRADKALYVAKSEGRNTVGVEEMVSD